jgi:hypothetical protein
MLRTGNLPQARKIGKAITINGEFLFYYDLHVVCDSICVLPFDRGKVECDNLL